MSITARKVFDKIKNYSSQKFCKLEKKELP
jgi:hypothetical protein